MLNGKFPYLEVRQLLKGDKILNHLTFKCIAQEFTHFSCKQSIHTTVIHEVKAHTMKHQIFNMY